MHVTYVTQYACCMFGSHRTFAVRLGAAEEPCLWGLAHATQEVCICLSVRMVMCLQSLQNLFAAWGSVIHARATACQNRLRCCIASIHVSHANMQDPFGNYVVQYVLELGHVEATATIMRQLYGQYPELAQQKFSSNVVEKCLKLGGPGLAECRERVIRELMVSPLLPRLLQVGFVPHVRLLSVLTYSCCT